MLGIKVRPLDGLSGVDYLAPGAVNHWFSFVFGPVIRVLEGVGYTKENMAAAPYDWRIPPRYLEKRDHFFSQLVKIVETMVKRTDHKVVLLSHSMGYRVVHYFIEFVKKNIPDGQTWVDTHVQFLLPISPIFLGSPRPLKAVLIGDKMDMDTFLTDEEAIFMARTWGSTPWLFPNFEKNWEHVRSFLYSRVEGFLKLTLKSVTFPENQRYNGEFDTYINVRFGDSLLHSTIRTASSGQVSAWENGEHFQLITADPSSPVKSDIIIVELRRREKGIAKIFHRVIGSAVISLKELLTKDNNYTVEDSFHLHENSHNLLDLVSPHKHKHLPTLQLKLVWVGGSGVSEGRLEGKALGDNGEVSLGVKYNGEMADFHISDSLLAPERKQELTDLVKEASTEAYQKLSKMTRNFKFQFEPRSIRDLVKDGAHDSYKQWEECYLQDPLYGSDVCLEMPFPKIKAIYGVNVDTELFYFFKRKNIRKENQYDCVYELDPAGHIDGYLW